MTLLAPGAFLAGLGTGLALIVAIGAQNAFVLRQGLRGEHVLTVVLACALSDAVLIVLGVTGFAQISAALPWLGPAMRYGGAAFLLWYGARAMVAALRADGALVVTPYYSKPSQAGLQRYFREISEASDLPIIVYNIKGRTWPAALPADRPASRPGR